MNALGISFLAVIVENVNDMKLIHEKTQMLRLSSLTNLDAEQQVSEPETSKGVSTLEQTLPSEEFEQTKTDKKEIPRAFISHSKNMEILEQIKDVLNFGEFEYRIAEDEETTAIPIPDKVFGLMRECNCAIINVSADDDMKQENGKYRINENVLIEVGAAFVHYDKRVILLVDKRIDLPSNLQGLYRCEYEGNQLSWDIGMKLQKALTEFKKSI